MFTIKPTIKTKLANKNFHETRPFSRSLRKFTPRENNPLYGILPQCPLKNIISSEFSWVIEENLSIAKSKLSSFVPRVQYMTI